MIHNIQKINWQDYNCDNAINLEENISSLSTPLTKSTPSPVALSCEI